MTINELREQLAQLRAVQTGAPSVVVEALEAKAVAVEHQIADAVYEANKDARAALNIKLTTFARSNKTLNELLDDAVVLGCLGFSYREYLDENQVATRNAKLIEPEIAKTVRAAKASKAPKAEGTKSKLYQNVITGEIQRLDGVYQDFANADERARMSKLDKADANYNSKSWRIKADVCQRVLDEAKVVAA